MLTSLRPDIATPAHLVYLLNESLFFWSRANTQYTRCVFAVSTACAGRENDGERNGAQEAL